MDPKSLVPTHLMEPTSSADLKKETEAGLAAAEKPRDEQSAMRRASYTFTFSFKGGNGDTFSGKFTHTVPDIGMRQRIGALRARLAGGVPYDVKDPFTRELNMIVADLTFTLDEKDRPTWANDLRTIINTDILYKLWEEVAMHEATFLGQRASEG